MQCTERPRDTERGDGSTSATAERTSSLRLPRLQHAVRALRPNRETDPERSPDWRSITRAPRTGFPRPFLTKARARQTSAALRHFDPAYDCLGSGPAVRRCLLNVRVSPRKRTSICELAMSHRCHGTNPLARERAVREGRSQWRQWSDRASRIGMTGRASRLEDQGVNNLHLKTGAPR